MVQLEPKPETRDTGLDLAVPAVAVLKQPHNATVIATATATASGALRRLRAPHRTEASRASLLIAQPEQLSQSMSLPGAARLLKDTCARVSRGLVA